MTQNFRKPEVCERLKELSPTFGDNGGMTAKTAVLFMAAQVIPGIQLVAEFNIQSPGKIQLMSRFQDNLRKDLAKIRIPTLVTSGSDDLVTSVKGKIRDSGTNLPVLDRPNFQSEINHVFKL